MHFSYHMSFISTCNKPQKTKEMGFSFSVPRDVIIENPARGFKPTKENSGHTNLLIFQYENEFFKCDDLFYSVFYSYSSVFYRNPTKIGIRLKSETKSPDLTVFSISVST